MDNNNPGTIPANQIKQKSSKGLITCAVLCAILAIAGAAFGGYAFIKLNEKNKKEEPVAKETKKETTIKESPISAAEAEEILEKYIDENDRVQMYDFFSKFDSLGFTNQLKLEYINNALNSSSQAGNKDYCDGDEHYTCKGLYSYDAINNLYTEYFGDAETLERKDYEYGLLMGWTKEDGTTERAPIYKLIYNEAQDGFVVYEPVGLGGTSPVRIIRKVTSVKQEGENIIGDLVYVTIDGQYAVEDHAKLVETTTDSLRVFEFTLSPYNDNYVLTGFEEVK